MKLGHAIVVFLPAILVCGFAPGHDDPPAKEARITSEWFTGVWVGWSEGYGLIETFRIRLDADGRGLFAISYSKDDEPQLYRVSHWEYKHAPIVLEPVPLTKGIEKISLEVEAAAVKELKLIVRGGDWSRTSHLVREDLFEARRRKLEKAMKRNAEERK